MYFNVNFNVFFILIKVHLLVCEVYMSFDGFGVFRTVREVGKIVDKNYILDPGWSSSHFYGSLIE